MEFDFEELKGIFLEYFYRYKKLFFIFVGILFALSVSIALYLKYDYDSRIRSSSMLLSYMNGESSDFLNKKHRKGYNLINQIIKLRNSPNAEVYEKFASMDDYLFKNLFYFSRKLYFGYSDDYEALYAANGHPWSKLIIVAGIFHGKQDHGLSAIKDDYLISYMIGKGMKC